MSSEHLKIGSPAEFTEGEKLTIVSLLDQQGKVIHPSVQKLNACQLLAAYISEEGEIVSIGAVKQKTPSDFSPEKADLEARRNDFQWELGYCYTDPSHVKKGHSSSIVQGLISKVGNAKLIASTETSGSSMRGILEKNGFKREGKTWKSGIHGGELGLFIRERL